MNIFYLNEKADIAAKQHVDKHVVKMIIEYAQLMSTAHRMLDGKQWYDKTANGRRIARWEHPEREKDAVLYKASHINHPSAIWARDSCANYEWLYSLWMNLCEEYTHRYGKVHLTQQKLQSILGNPPINIKQDKMSKVPQAMPEDVKQQDSVKAYQEYYRNYKSNMAKWTKREAPEWYYAA